MQEVRSSNLLGSISRPRPGEFDVSSPYVFVDRRLSDVPTEALLQFLEGAADISSSVSHVRLATEAEVNRLLLGKAGHQKQRLQVQRNKAALPKTAARSPERPPSHKDSSRPTDDHRQVNRQHRSGINCWIRNSSLFRSSRGINGPSTSARFMSS